MNYNRTEKGQTLVLIVLAIVGLMGFAALSVDVGLIYSVRRQAQTAADSAALAAAAATQRGGNSTTAALSLLAQNGFGADTDPYANLTIEEDVQIYNPPISGPYSTVANKNEYYQIVIRKSVRKIFSQFVFAGQEIVTVESIAHSKPSQLTSAGNAMHATSGDACPGIIFDGNGKTSVTGGSIFSNSTRTNTSGNCASGIKKGSAGNINITGGELRLAGSWIQNENSTVSPAPVTGVDPITLEDLPAPSCDGLPARTFNRSNHTLLPGVYASGIEIRFGDYTMQPGLYCITGGDFLVNGGTLRSEHDTATAGVVIYMGPDAGGIDFSGNAYLWLSTGQSVLDGKGDNFSGYLIFMDKNNHNGVDMSGSTNTFYHGTIYAPSYRDPATKEKCNIGGNNDLTLRSNIICNTIGIAGDATVTIDYRPEENARTRPSLDLTQ